MESPNVNQFKDIKLGNENDNRASSTASSDFDRLEDYNEAEFKGATLSLSQETSPPASGVASAGNTSPNMISTEDNMNANISRQDSVGGGANGRRPSTMRLLNGAEVWEFFAVREGALQKAAEQCRPVILDHLDGELRGIWLLTEIDHWDTEKERLLFLTDNSLISLKYDFITLRLLDYKRHALKQFEQIIVGELKYPENSLMPRINGAMDFIKEKVIPKIRQGKNSQQLSQAQRHAIVTNKLSARKQLGVQCIWNHAHPIPALKRWNPWSREIPWVTYTSHPLLKMDNADRANYDIEDFTKKLAAVIENLDKLNPPLDSTPTSEKTCSILYQPIIIESYAGIAAALHNANELGFFKSRGKVSF